MNHNTDTPEKPVLSGHKTPTEALKDARWALDEIAKLSFLNPDFHPETTEGQGIVRAFQKIHELASAGLAKSHLYPEEKVPEAPIWEKREDGTFIKMLRPCKFLLSMPNEENWLLTVEVEQGHHTYVLEPRNLKEKK